MEAEIEQVYARYRAPVRAYLARFTGDAWLADECCQETFLRFLREGRTIVGGNGAVGAWLYRVATNLALDRLRRRRPLPLREGSAATPRDAVEAADLDAFVRREVDALPAGLRAAFLLRAHHELTFPAIADALGVSERTAKERFRRARDILAHRLGPVVLEDRR